MSDIVNTPTLIGDAGDELLVGGVDGDIIHGDLGDDRIFGALGDDTLIGGAGNDQLFGGAPTTVPGDSVGGGQLISVVVDPRSGDNDVLYGGLGDDTLFYDRDAEPGEDGLERLFGGDGFDTLALNFTIQSYTAEIEAEVVAYFNAVQAGADPGSGVGSVFAFDTLGLEVSGFETVSVTVQGVIVPPGEAPPGRAVDDVTFETPDMTSLDGDVSTNDGTQLGGVFALVDDVDRGVLTFNEDGTFTFNPAEDFFDLSVGETAIETFTYSLTVDQRFVDIATVELTVQGANEDPIAPQIFVNTDEDTPATLDLLSDAFDLDASDVLSVASVNGVALNGGSAQFQLASGAEVTAFADGRLDYDPTGAFDFLIGDLQTPQTAFEGFDFTISDGNGGSDTQSVTIIVAGVNDAPVAVDDAFGFGEDGQGFIDVLANDFDLDDGLAADPIVDFDADGSDGGQLIRNAVGDLEFFAGDDFAFLGAGEAIDTTFTYTIADVFGEQSTATITITVTGENAAPVADGIFDATGEDDPYFADIIFDGGVVDPDGDPLSIAAVDGDALIADGQTFLLGSGATVTANIAGDFTYDPTGAFDFLAEGDQSDDFFEITVTDGNGGFVDVSVDLAILGVNDPPEIGAIDVVVGQNDAPIQLDLLEGAFDVEDDPLIVDLIQQVDGRPTDPINGFAALRLEGGGDADLLRRPTVLGDVDGDGIDDLFVDLIDPAGPGRVALIFGGVEGLAQLLADGDAAFSFDELASLGTETLIFEGVADGDTFGEKIGAPGDYNGDGALDFVISAADAGTGGEAYVIFGGEAALTALAGQTGVFNVAGLDGSNGFRIGAADAGDTLGNDLAVEQLGDIDGDGRDDLQIGARLADPAGLDFAGETFILSGASLAGMADATGFIDVNDATTTGGYRIDGAAVGPFSADFRGHGDTQATGDFDGDGINDILIGQPLGNAYLDQTGEAYLVFGGAANFEALDAADEVDDNVIEINSLSGDLNAGPTGATGYVFVGGEGDQAGFGVISLGDVNGDGIDDFAISSIERDDPGYYYGSYDEATGETYVVFGGRANLNAFDENDTSRDGRIILGDVGAGFGFRIEGGQIGAESGFRIASAGDVDGDGLSDFLIGSNAIETGEVGTTHLVFGGALGALDAVSGADGVISLNDIDGTNGFSFREEAAGDQFGVRVAAGDITGDGETDLLIDAASFADATGPIGATYAILGGVAELAALDALDGAADGAIDVSLALATPRDIMQDGFGAFIDNGDGTATFDPSGFADLGAGETEDVVFEYLVDDGFDAVLNTLTVTVTGVNDAPTANALAIATSEDRVARIALPGADPDGDPLTFTFDPVAGLSEISNGVLEFDPTASFNDLVAGEIAQQTFTYTVTDDAGLSDDETVTITVTGVNDAPEATPLSATTDETDAGFTFDLAAGVTDADAGSSFVIQNFFEAGTSFGGEVVGATFSFDATTLSALEDGESQVIEYLYDVVDDFGASVSNSFSLTVNGAPSGVFAEPDTFTTDEDTPLFGDVSGNDTPQTATFTLLDPPFAGDLVFNDDGTFAYDPLFDFDQLNDGEQQVVTFNYQIDDGVDTAIGDVSINIEGVDDAPGFLIPSLSSVDLFTLNIAGDNGGNGQSLSASIADDGSLIAFNSSAGDLVAGDTNARTDVFFGPLPQSGLARANLTEPGGAQSTTDGAFASDVSGDGRFIVFASRSSDLVALPNNNQIDVYVRDTVAGVTELVTFNNVGGRINGSALNPSISANGRFVVYESTATNLTDEDENGATSDVFLTDRATGETIIVSQEPIAAQLSASFQASISADGSTVVYTTRNNIDDADVGGIDIYAYDVASGATTLVSRTAAGANGNRDSVSTVGGESIAPSVSANGRYVAFTSQASDLITGDGNGRDDVFVYDMVTGEMERASVSLTGQEGDGHSFRAEISANGRFVAFQSQATTLDAIRADTNGDNDVFVYDRITQDTIRVSVAPDSGDQPGGGQPTISADGTIVAFSSGTNTGSFDPRVTTGDVNDIYVATIDPTGFEVTDGDGVLFLDLVADVFDPEGADLRIDGVTVTSDNAARVVDFATEFDPQTDADFPEIEIDFSQFADLGANEYEILTVEYDVVDTSGSVFSTAAIVVRGVNDAPVGDDVNFETGRSQELLGQFTATDIDGDQLFFAAPGGGPSGDFFLNLDGSFSYTPDDGAVGVEEFTVEVSDGLSVATLSATITINEAPVFNGADGSIVAIVNEPNSIDVSTLFTDFEGDDLTFSAQQTSGDPLTRLNIDAATGVISGTPLASGVDRIEITATDTFGNATTGEAWLSYVAELALGTAAAEELATTNFSNGFFSSGAGNDLILSDNGFDVIQYDFDTDGFDQIQDESGVNGAVILIEGALSTEVSFTRVGSTGEDLLISLAGEETSLDRGLYATNGLDPQTVANFRFADGEIITTAEIRAQIVAGGGGAELTQLGFDGADLLIGGVGDETLSGRRGGDTYVIEPGGGDDVIIENGFLGDDVIDLGFSFSQTTVSRGAGPTDLLLEFDTGDSVLVVDTLNQSNFNHVERIDFLDASMTMSEFRDILVAQQSTTDSDVIWGSDSFETIIGGLGDDTLIGQDGQDIYIYAAGDGNDVIKEGDVRDDDTVQISGFNLDIDPATGKTTASSEVTFRTTVASPNSLIIDLDNGVDQGSIAIDGTLGLGNSNSIEFFTFVDQGLTLTDEEIAAILIAEQPTPGDDIIIGSRTSDVIASGTGEDYVTGREQDDTYQYFAGDGRLTIFDNARFDSDRLEFFGYDFDDLTFSRSTAQRPAELVIRPTTPATGQEGDEITIIGGLDVSFGVIDTFADGSGVERSLDEIKALMLLADAADADGTVTGFDGADIMPATPGVDTLYIGGGGDDVFTYAAGEGNDVYFLTDENEFSSQTINFAGVSSTDGFTMRTNISRPNDVRIEFGGGDSLTIQRIDKFNSFVFDDVTFDRDGFAAFVDANDVELPIVQGTTGNETLTSTAANEVLAGGGNSIGGTDTYVFSVDALGDDVIHHNGDFASNADIVIDFTFASGFSVLEETVTFSTFDQRPGDLLITVVYEDQSVVDPVPGVGRIEGSILVDEALAGGAFLSDLTILSSNGATQSFTRADIARQMTAQLATEFDDVIIGYNGIAETISGGAGDDYLRGGSSASDTYLFGVGDGRDMIDDGGFNDADELRITGYSLADAVIRHDPGELFDSSINDFVGANLILDFGDDELTLRGALNPDPFSRLESIVFDAGGAAEQTLTAEELIAEFLARSETPGDDRLIGGDGADDDFAGGPGDDFYRGRRGDDTYRLAPGEGWDVIDEAGNAGTDTVIIDADLADVTVGYDFTATQHLTLTFADGSGAKLLNSNALSSASYIDLYQFNDVTLTAAEMRARLLDTLQTAGDDLVFGRGLSETLQGGAGDDTLEAGFGADTYIYSVGGEGDDVIEEVPDNGSVDVLEIRRATLAETEFTRGGVEGERLIISFTSGEGSVTILSALRGNDNSTIETIFFADTGESVSIDEARQLAYAAEADATDQFLFGLDSTDDTLSSGGGDDTLDGRGGNDTYVFTAGDGVLTIQDTELSTDALITQSLTVRGFGSTDAVIRRLALNSQHFEITFDGSSDKIIVLGDVSAAEILLGVETIFFEDDGVTFDEATINAMLGAGGSAPTAGGGPLTGGPMAPPSGDPASDPAPDPAAPSGDPAGPSQTSSGDEPAAGDDPAGGGGPAPAPVVKAGAAGDDRLQGGGMDDTLSGRGGDDTLKGRGGDDLLRGGGGEDRLAGGGGDDRLRGGGGDDVLRGGGGADDLKGGAGGDTLKGGGGDDRMNGGGGADELKGGAGADTLEGRGGGDELNGGGGGDVISGGGGADRLLGRGGADRLEGEAGDDIYVGGGGVDIFVFNLGHGEDVVRDFQLGVDKLDFSGHARVGSVDDLTFAVGDGDVVLLDNAGGQIRLEGVRPLTLEDGDFFF